MLPAISSLESSRPSSTLVRISSGTTVVKKVRISSRKAWSSGDRASCMGSLWRRSPSPAPPRVAISR